MPYNEALKTIFIHPSKCAGKSIETAMFGFKPMQKSDHKPIGAYSLELVEECFVFSFVRNPWDRVVSAMFDATNRVDPKSFSVDHLHDHLEASQVKNGFKPLLGGAMKTYKHFFHNFQGVYVMDWVGRFEQLQDDWNVLCQMLNIELELPRINSRHRKRPHYSHFYDDATRELVSQLFAWDIEFFGYEFEDLT